jgi:hypothetical protein
MPIEGYAFGHLKQDNVSQFLLQLAGHAANYAQRGTFGTSEQLSLYSTLDSRWRDYLPAQGQTAQPRNPAELSLDFCEPSQMQMAMMTRWQLLYEDPDEAVLWVAKGAPRRWFAPSAAPPLFSIARAPTRMGLLGASFEAVPCPTTTEAATCEAAVRVVLSLSRPGNESEDDTPEQYERIVPVTIFVRVRSPLGNTTISHVVGKGDAMPARELVRVVTPVSATSTTLLVLFAAKTDAEAPAK